MFKQGLDQQAEPFLEGISIEKYFQSQLLPPVYGLNGVVDVIQRNVVMDNTMPLYGRDMRIMEIPAEKALDIDTELDFSFCEFVMKSMNS
jgi:CMP-N-acetylneuraminic acid synthetase